MRNYGQSTAARLMAGAAACAIVAGASGAWAQSKPITVEPQPLMSALHSFGSQTGAQILYAPEILNAKVSSGVAGAQDEQLALTTILAGTGLTFRREASAYVIVRQGEGGSSPQSGSAAGGGAEVEALIVTAQKREEDIQDVPIAISAFTQESLERSQIAGGPDLMTQIPNMTFTKTNFTGYSIQLRGIGTQAISATTDPAVAVAFNNTPFVRNHFFEQEFYDLERVEVLRGPQGTLYGRNATAGVVNIISAKPKFRYEAKLSGDLGNYNSTRLEGMVNIPLVEDIVALRLAGAWTKRDGYSTNEITGNPIDGRDLWSTRVTLRFSPTDALDANLIWEHFEENDDRLRSGKQVCMKDPNKTSLAGVAFPVESQPGITGSKLGTYNQGCIPASIYAPESYQTPNGYALPYYQPLSQLNLPTVVGLDPYANSSQSRDLRIVESIVDPHYRAKSNVAELQVRWDIGDNLTLQSETAYSTDELFSTQDYNRFNTARGAFDQEAYDRVTYIPNSVISPNVLVDGVFCDPQIGCADRLVAVDLSTAQSRNFSQELRLSSDYEGPFNFSLGANFTRYDTEDKYYVFINTLSMWAAMRRGLQQPKPYVAGVTDNADCLDQPLPGDPAGVFSLYPCIYMDPNPIGSLNDQGHNYFLSKNPYRLISYAAFGELYYNITDDLKLTGGLRWTVDKKRAPLVPSWLLATGTVGYPVKEVLDLEWREPTGRLAIDWKPDLSFTDETLLYASYAHGYKAGGANPPPMVVVSLLGKAIKDKLAESVLHPKTFDPEFIDAFEVGAKNTLLDGRVTLNASAFYYDYKGYQISQIVDRTAVNSNYDAKVWGLELETEWRPMDNLRLGFKGGYEQTKLANGTLAIDLMDRTAGDPNWVLAKPYPSMASNCILPVWLVTYGNRINTIQTDGSTAWTAGDAGFCLHAYVEGLDPVTLREYEPNPQVWVDLINGGQIRPIRANWAGYPGFDPTTAPNGGAGIAKDIGGNELPNAPHYTATLTADYSLPLAGDWLANLHVDLYYQSEAWLRVFNTEGYDKLKAYTNVNLAATFTNEDAGWKVMAYVKNVFDRDSITGAFLNSDDSGLTTNVFLTEPRLYGLRVTKEWNGGSLLGRFGARHEGPYPFTLELGGQIQRHDAPYQTWMPGFSSAFPASLDPLDSQNRALDWGDGREVKLAYRAGPWSLSLGARSGETNHSAKSFKREHGDTTCSYVGGQTTCLAKGTIIERDNYSDALVFSDVDHTIVDLVVGRDFGIGGRDGRLIRSKIGAGLRYARLQSSTSVQIDGTPDWTMPDFSIVKYGFTRVFLDSQHTTYDARLAADREFEGAGPVVSWDGSLTLLGDEDVGHLDLDASVVGGVLFGKQKTEIVGSEVARYYSNWIGDAAPMAPDLTTVAPPIDVDRSKSVTVPVLDLSLGLSYKVDRFSIGAGYRWERYFDAIDGGVTAHEDEDRTIDGPYFKIAVGFGG